MISYHALQRTPKAFARHGGQAEQAGQNQQACWDALDFVSVPGFPSAILVFALTHSRRIVHEWVVHGGMLIEQ
jgi:hypothetical protein